VREPRLAATVLSLLAVSVAAFASEAGGVQAASQSPGASQSASSSQSSSASQSSSPSGGGSPATPAPRLPSAEPQSPGLPSADVEAPLESVAPPASQEKYQWLDETRALVYQAIWESAMHVDRWFGSEEPDWAYEQVSGSVVPGLVYSRFYGTQKLLRFIGNVPLPQLSDSLHAFIGRFNPEEYIAESQAASGVLPNPYAPYNTDQTLFGIQYNQPVHPGIQWDTGAGLPITLSRFDPYFKGGYLYEIGSPEDLVLAVRQDGFYQSTQGGFGVTTRFDLQKLINPGLLLSWTVSTTYAQRSYGWNSYSVFDVFFSYAESRALVFELDGDDITQAPVPIQDYGGRLAYRRSILRDWLILEVRTGVDWPKYYPWQHRELSPTVGIAFEMEFGAQTFLARPVTF
jgi:hypothetical protein